MVNQINPDLRESEKHHKQQFLWQILLPVLVGALIVIGIGILVIVSSGQDKDVSETWSRISLVLLILPNLLVGLIQLALLIFAIYLINKFHHFLPPQFEKLIHITNTVTWFTQKSTNNISNPIIYIKSFFAGAIRLLNLAYWRDTTPKED